MQQLGYFMKQVCKSNYNERQGLSEVHRGPGYFHFPRLLTTIKIIIIIVIISGFIVLVRTVAASHQRFRNPF
jgi:hypothetical protein